MSAGGPEFKWRVRNPPAARTRRRARRAAAQELGRRQPPPAGALQLRQVQRAVAASHGDARRRSTASTSPGTRRERGPKRAAPALDQLAVERAARAGKRVERAQATLDRRRGCAPVDRRLGLVDLGGVGDARRRAAARAASRPRAASAPAPRRPVGRRAPPGGRAACAVVSSAAMASRRPSSMAPVSSPASICMMRDAGRGVAGLDRAVDRRGAAPARQQRRVDVQAAARAAASSTHGGRISP